MSTEIKETEVKKNKGRKPNRKQARAMSKDKDFRKEVRREVKAAAENDIGWYSRYPAIYDAASNLIWSRPTGVATPRTFEVVGGSGLGQANGFLGLPGIMALSMVHGIGSTFISGTNASVNVATKAIYTWVRHMNSGHANYDGPDLMLYFLAMNEAYAAIAFIGRIFGTIAMYSGGNRLLPDALLDMMDVDAASIRDNFANFRARMNILIQKASSLVVPIGLDIFKRTTFLYSNYYTEGDSVKDQIYLMKPSGFRVFDRDSSGAGYLKWYDMSNWYSGGKLTWGSLCQLMEDILTPLIADEDINIMAGDILKAYGESGIQKLVFLPEMFISTPQNVEEVLWQIKNAKIISGSVSNLDITQDGNHEYLIFEPTVTAAPADVLANSPQTLLVTNKVPTKEINMINSRLAAAVDYGVYGATPNAGQIICGSDFVRSAEVLYIGNTNTPLRFNLSRYVDMGTPNTGDYLTMCMLSSFKYAPEVTVVSVIGNYVANMSFFDLDDFTLVDRSDLITIHDAAMLSLFATPHVGM